MASMTTETELKALMLASQEGDSAAHRMLLERLSRHLRAYYKGKLAKIGREDRSRCNGGGGFGSGGRLGHSHAATHVRSGGAVDSLDTRDCALQTDRLSSPGPGICGRCAD